LHNYIRINSQDDAIFTVFEQHPNHIPHDELLDIDDGYQGSERPERILGRSTRTKERRNNSLMLHNAILADRLILIIILY